MNISVIKQEVLVDYVAMRASKPNEPLCCGIERSCGLKRFFLRALVTKVESSLVLPLKNMMRLSILLNRDS